MVPTREGFHFLTLPYFTPCSYRKSNPWYDRPYSGQSMTKGVVVHRVPSGVAYTDTALVSEYECLNSPKNVPCICFPLGQFMSQL